jgi:hypothetical protein
MLHLAVKLPPPPKGSVTGKMRPKDFLLLSPIKRKLKDFVEFSPKRVRLDPTPQDDHATVESYNDDASAKLGNDRRKRQVLLPLKRENEDLKR